MKRTGRHLLLSAGLVLASLVLPPASGALGPPSGEATPRCDGRVATIVGSARSDRLVGTPGNDVIVGLGGSDRIEGRGGDDVICGGDDDDRLDGGAGDDRIFGDAARFRSDPAGEYLVPNRVIGGPGDDFIDAGVDRRRVDDPIYAEAGIVSYASSTGAVHVDLSGERGRATGAGDDTIVVSARLTVEGSAFDDVLVGSALSDHLVGGHGNDRLVGRGGDDVLTAEATSGRGPADDDSVVGGSGDDLMTTFKGSDVLHGGRGDDVVQAYSSRPGEVYGDAGDDELALVLGAGEGYVLSGGAGHDSGDLNSPLLRCSESGCPPQDVPEVTTVRTGPGTIEQAATLIGTVGGVEEYVLDEVRPWIYYGTDAPDVVDGGLNYAFEARTYGGDDVVDGTLENDHIYAGRGDDTVDGRAGRDVCLSAERHRNCERL